MMKLDRKIEKNPIPRKNTLHLASCSNLRRNIMISLKGGKKQLGELRDDLKVSSTTAIHALRELEKGTLIFQGEDRAYALTIIGEIIALKLEDYINAIDTLKKHEKFWLEHDLRDIPVALLEKIGDLSKSVLLSDTPTDTFKSHTTYIQILEHATEVHGIYPIFNLEYFEILKDLVRRKKIDVEIIVTNEVLDSIGGLIETEEPVKDFFEDPNFALFAVDEPIKIALTLTDSVFYLGLFARNGLYDYNRALLSDDQTALSWGKALYAHYRRLSEEVDL